MMGIFLLFLPPLPKKKKKLGEEIVLHDIEIEHREIVTTGLLLVHVYARRAHHHE